ncbi:imelysin family protein [Vibrio breoganii]|uniref:imelysin family protein n=1 Tax=Vibrio breoganii TaxID=553239 RepID=UPI000C8619F9|nr:imelysin family protein [Vibrio breoganii]PMK59371.1 hypothetical protein BCT98_06290 [Vibrio breoganii]PMK76080.1 hypothetical protein BCT94_07920 [Vibrio breoganii]PMO76311.1 hypothetical protein BCT02_10500 [Vibrio breoganii]PMO89030.1 hypothetical protein BCS99_06060 [Vibrio breoganii]PMP02144.1 hypothetical protein BCS95_12665 [Vibrio breoganii]
MSFPIIKPSMMALVFSILLVGCSNNSPSPSDRPSTQVNQFEVTQHLSQAVYQLQHQHAERFYSNSAKLHQAFQTQCLSSSDESSLNALQNQWHETMLAWMPFQGQNNGPNEIHDLAWKVQFWPDKKNTTGRQIKAQLSSNPHISSKELANLSATLQGLSAIEWLLYDDAAQESNLENRCALGITISQRLLQTSITVRDAWSINPWKDLEKKQWNVEYISMLNDQLDYMQKKLSRPLAKIGKPRPYFTESWRSQTSYANLFANWQGINALVHAPNGLIDILQDVDPVLAESISSTIKSTVNNWPIDASLFADLGSAQGYQRALAQYNKIEYVHYLIATEAAMKLGIVVGFNSTDGD